MDYIRHKNRLTYIKDSIRIILTCLPYALISVGCIAGSTINSSLANSLGASVIAAFGVFNGLGPLWSILTRLIATSMCTLVAKEKDLEQKNMEVEDITSTALAVNLIASLFMILFIFIFHESIATFFSTGDSLMYKLLDNLLLMRCLLIPIEAVSLIQDQYLAAMRKNKLLFYTDVLFYIVLVAGDLIALWFGFGGEGIFAATIIAYIVYVGSMLFTSRMKLGKIKKNIAKELIRLSTDMLPDRVCQQITYVIHTKIATTFGTETYALVTVAYLVEEVYEAICDGLADGWSVYVCEWLSGARDEVHTIYTKRKNIVRQAKYFSLISLILLGILFLLSVYFLWFLFGRVFAWEDCKASIFIAHLLFLSYIFYLSNYEMLKASGESKCLRWTSLVGGICVRVPVQLIGVYVFGGQILALAFGQMLDFLVRTIYLNKQVKRSKRLNSYAV